MEEWLFHFDTWGAWVTFLDQNGPPEHLTRLFELSGGSEKNLIFGTGDLGSKMAKNWNLNMAHWITKFSCSLVWVTSRAQKKLSTHRCDKFLHRCTDFSSSWLWELNWLPVGRLCEGSFSDHFLTRLLLGYPLGAKIKQTEGAKGSNFKKENFFKKIFRKFFLFFDFWP